MKNLMKKKLTIIGPAIVAVALITAAQGVIAAEKQAKSSDSKGNLSAADRKFAEKIRKFFEAEKYTFLPLLQKDGAISKPYRVEGCPTNYLIGPDGKILERVTGALVEDNLRDFVEHSLPKK